MGEPKGLLRVGTQRWLETQLCALRNVGLERVTVVLGHHARRYQTVFPWLSEASERSLSREGLKLDVGVNPRPEEGAFSSIKTGLLSLLQRHPAITACYVLPIDVPCPDASVWSSLWEGLGDRSVCQAVFQGRGGHPVLLGNRWLRWVAAQSNQSRLDFLLQNLPPIERVRIEVGDRRVLENLNTPEAWQAYHRLSR
jgi:CTP:molybdopterin cytidylyltransferase MocA